MTDKIWDLVNRLRFLAGRAAVILTDPPMMTESAKAMTEAADLLERMFTPGRIQVLEESTDLSAMPFREKDVRRGLILFRTSNNAHGYVNFEMLTGKVEDLPSVAKLELANMMDSLSEQLRTDALSSEPGLTEEEKKSQAAKCPCRGANDFCTCQNEVSHATRRARSPKVDQ